MMSLKTHSTDTLTLLMALFQSISFWVSLAPLKGLCNCGRWGYAGSPYKHNGSPFVALEYNTSWLYKLDSASIELSCRFPSTGQYKLANRQFGTETDWNFMAWTFLCPLYSTLWFLPVGKQVWPFHRQIQNNSAKLPPAWKVALIANVSKLSGESQGWFSEVSKWLQCVYK